ncbi:MAG: 50S ribosomal protein L21, partial [Bacteroidota bacterium]
SKVEFDKVLLIDNGKNVSVGTPVVKEASVTATVLEHVKGDKVLVFKKKKKKGYQKLNGHRQYFTQIQIESIHEKGTKKAAGVEKAEIAEEKKAAPKAEAKEEAPKAAAKKTTKTAKKEE